MRQICMTLIWNLRPAGISKQEIEEVEGKIARSVRNSGRKKCFHLRRSSRLIEHRAIVPAVSLSSTKVKI
jgi:hypothetical protein